jgi:hypothetical protein
MVAVGDGQYRYPAGSKLADSQGNALAGDIVSSYWTTKLTVNHVPLDTAAVTAMTNSGFTGMSIGVKANGAPGSITGSDSVR